MPAVLLSLLILAVLDSLSDFFFLCQAGGVESLLCNPFVMAGILESVHYLMANRYGTGPVLTGWNHQLRKRKRHII